MFQIMNKILSIILLVFVVSISNFSFGQTGMRFWWRAAEGDTSFNFNPSKVVGAGNTLVFDSIPYSEDYTLLIVYHALTNDEQLLWHLDFTPDGSRGLTTQCTMIDSIRIRHSDITDMGPIISTLRQSAPDSASGFARLTIGSDTASGRFKVSEIIYFDNRIGIGQLRRIQGSLAIRYGVTLGPVDYPDGQGRYFWHNNEEYRHRVTGVGREITWALNQTRSRSQVDGAILTLSSDSLADGDFLVCGDNNAPLLFEDINGMQILQRRWRTELTGNNEHFYSLTFDVDAIEGQRDSLLLLVDDNIFSPSLVTPTQVRFDSVWFPPDTSFFTLGRGSVLWNRQLANTNYAHGVGSTIPGSNIQTSIYPNPSLGQYTLEVSDAGWVKAVIYNTLGAVVATHEGSDKRQYLFSGALPTGNVYYVTVTTEAGASTTKLVVK